MKGSMKYLFRLFIVCVAACLCSSCSPQKSSAHQISRPAFSADSAYKYIADQLSFGPRVPNSQGHTNCVIYIVHQLRRFGADVTLQKGMMTDYSGRVQPIVNIIGTFWPDSIKDSSIPRLLLCAHYDTRPWCDQEEEYSNRFLNVPGANDGASGVGVLLEVARAMSKDNPNRIIINKPVEIVFFDVEDMGTPDFYTGEQRENTWCLGSQLWAQGVDTKQYSYGVLLDMVGAPDACFPREYYSTQYASNYVEKIWRSARELGYGRYFDDRMSYPIVDDHYYVNLAGVPCVDIIHYDMKSSTGFPEWWHTSNDNMDNIDKGTLQAVGEVILTCLN